MGTYVTASTIISTSDGDQLVSDLIGRQFTAIVADSEYTSDEHGFWFVDRQQVYKLLLENGYEITSSGHTMLRVYLNDRQDEWKEMLNLSTTDKIMINDLTYSKVESIIDYGEENVYDCKIPDSNYFIANGILVHL